MPMQPPKFDIALRGYDQRAVDELVDRAMRGLDVRDQVSTLSVVLRGYDRQQVEDFFKTHKPSL